MTRSGRLANPFLLCLDCGARVEAFRLGPGVPVNEPCGHPGGYQDACPSWSPVDGCRCAEHLGEVPHAPAQPATLGAEETCTRSVTAGA